MIKTQLSPPHSERKPSNPQPIEFSGILLVKRQKIILLYIILAQQKRRRHKIPLPHKAT